MLEDDGFIKISQVLHCAVYALVKKGEVVYIGKSKKPLQRIATHNDGRKVKASITPAGIPTVPRISFDDVWILGCMLGQLDTLERTMIKKYRPKYNHYHNPDKQGPVVIPEDIRALLATLAPELPPSRDSFSAPVGRFIVRRL